MAMLLCCLTYSTLKAHGVTKQYTALNFLEISYVFSVSFGLPSMGT